MRALRVRGDAVALVLIAFIIQAVIPTGFMPALKHGVVQIVMCRGLAPGPGSNGHPRANTDAPCVFACAGASAPPLPAISAVPTRIAVRLAEVPREDGVAAEPRPRYVSARGPPRNG